MKFANRRAGYLTSFFLIRTFGAQRKSSSAMPAGCRCQGREPDEATESQRQPTGKVCCLPSEHQENQALADAAGLTVSTYLLRVGLEYRIEGILDNKRVEELARINGDLGRLGGLIEAVLTTLAPQSSASPLSGRFSQRSKIFTCRCKK